MAGADPRDRMAALGADLADETADLVRLLEPLEPPEWRLATPAEGWSIADQVSHLAYFDETALLSATDPERFRREADELVVGGDDFPDRIAAAHRHRDGAELLAWFRRARQELLEGFTSLDPAVRLPWYGPPMAPASALTARLMETWAHGQDVADTLGVTRTPTTRLRHVAHLGVRTAGFAFTLNGRVVPTTPVRVELTGPAGEPWAWGPDDAADHVTGTALDFCLVVTQRRHLDDTGLRVAGPVVQEWMSIAQAFAGAAAGGRPRTAGAAEVTA